MRLEAFNARREFSIEFFPRGEFPAAKRLGGHRGFARDLQAGRTGTLLMTAATETADPAFRIACMLLSRSEMRMMMDFISVKEECRLHRSTGCETRSTPHHYALAPERHQTTMLSWATRI